MRVTRWTFARTVTPEQQASIRASTLGPNVADRRARACEARGRPDLAQIVRRNRNHYTHSIDERILRALDRTPQ